MVRSNDFCPYVNVDSLLSESFIPNIYIYIQPLSHACPHSLTGRKGLHHQRQQPNEPTSIVVPSTLLPDSGPSSPTDHDNRHFIPSFPSYDDHVGLKAIQNPPGTKKNLATGTARGAEGRSQEGRGDYLPEAVVKNGKAAIAAIASVSVPSSCSRNHLFAHPQRYPHFAPRCSPHRCGRVPAGWWSK